MSQQPQGSDRRRYPRVPVAHRTTHCVLEDVPLDIDVQDISRGGLRFLSDRNFSPGQRMRVNIRMTFSADVEVVHKDMVMVDETFLEAKYRVGAAFVSGPMEPEEFELVLAALLDVPSS